MTSNLKPTEIQRHDNSERYVDFYLQHRRLFEVLCCLLFGLIFIGINIYVIAIDGTRMQLGESLGIMAIQEFTSIAIILSLLPLVLRFDQYWPLNRSGLPWNILAHAGFTVVFSILHVAGMVALRHLLFSILEHNYHFGNWWQEWFFEYLKDFRTYVLIVAVIYLYRLALARLQGDARLVDNDLPISCSERVLVKKLGKEFILNLQSIEWLESAGNYVNLHLEGKVYPLRATMAEMQQKMPPDSFVRIHRSYMINLQQLKHIKPTGNGGAVVQLIRGNSLSVSRRYLNVLRQSISEN